MGLPRRGGRGKNKREVGAIVKSWEGKGKVGTKDRFGFVLCGGEPGVRARTPGRVAGLSRPDVDGRTCAHALGRAG